jgi:hypothetical protein
MVVTGPPGEQDCGGFSDPDMVPGPLKAKNGGKRNGLNQMNVPIIFTLIDIMVGMLGKRCFDWFGSGAYAELW